MVKNESIHVFTDLEGLGKPISLVRTLESIKRVGKELGPALLREGYSIAGITGFACYKRKYRDIPAGVQWLIRDLLRGYGWNMVWSKEIADTALIGTVRNDLSIGALSKSVMIVANDRHFSTLVRQLRASGIFVFVSGPEMSHKLIKAADRAEKLWDFLARSERCPALMRRDAQTGSVPFNPIPLK